MQRAQAPAKFSADGFEPLEVDEELKKFGKGGNLQKEIVEAQADLVQDIPQKNGEGETAGVTIAMFNYLDSHANEFNQAVTEAFTVLKGEKDRGEYLQGMSNEMHPKLAERGLWVEDDRIKIAKDQLNIGEYFKEGKARLLEKAQETKDANKRLYDFLLVYSGNLDAKSYGKRLESLNAFKIAKVPDPAIASGKPLVNTPIPYDQAGYTYYHEYKKADGEDVFEQVQPANLSIGVVYTLNVNNSRTYAVTIGSNSGGSVTFSKVED